eukprot:5434017-Prymnesium_polylepis.1
MRRRGAVSLSAENTSPAASRPPPRPLTASGDPGDRTRPATPLLFFSATLLAVVLDYRRRRPPRGRRVAAAWPPPLCAPRRSRRAVNANPQDIARMPH